MKNFLTDLNNCLQTGFVDLNTESKRDYLPVLLINDNKKKEKVLTTLLRELDSCDEFLFSVAFVTKSGVATIINQLKELESKNIRGKILVSQYQNFTEPEALKSLLQFSNLELKIVVEGNFHSKGYIFRKGPSYHLIIGSSNLTANALCLNKEWNVKLSSNENGHLIHSVLDNFHGQFKEAVTVNHTFIKTYEEIYKANFQKFLSDVVSAPVVKREIQPNKMQIEALESLKQLRLAGKNKALLVSATGTGKTYLCAFDVRNHKPKKVLFIVHRGNIAQKAMESFREVIGNDVKMGMYSGQKREADADYIFSTVQTIAQTEHLQQFKPDHFDYIVIDETHRSGASSYQKILSYLKPNFLLGMTATPERMDGFNIFSQFDNNLAFEIRLHRALAEGMLCDFHYYGVRDITVNNQLIEEKSAFNLLVAEERVNRIIEKSRFYGCDSGIVRGLIFCSKVEEAQALSNAFNKRGFRTIALSGNDSIDQRQQAIDLLESNDLTKKLHYIFTVDIFNEGIDIPKVNQIIMLRPTQSAIIFVQQLGRGLRKAEGKDHLTVIDFIGNYYNNFLLPIALFGDTSYNKDTIRKLLKDGPTAIPGASTVNFDPITKQQIFKAIDTANLSLRRDLIADYNLLKMRIGRSPMMMDFVTNQLRDPFVFVSTSGSYYNFIAQNEAKFVSLNKQQVLLLELLSTHICNGKRIEETIILQELLKNDSVSFAQIKQIIKKDFGVGCTDSTLESCEWNLNFDFIRKPHKVVIANNEIFKFHNEFQKELNNGIFLKFLKDALDYSHHSYSKSFSKDRFTSGFMLYNKYSRRDVCRILNWEKDESATVYGYKVGKGACPIFVTYYKAADISSTTKYEDEFVNNSTFQWMSKSNRKLDSPEIVGILSGKLRMPLFIKKSDGESSDFYYMGDVKPLAGQYEQTSLFDEKNKKQIPVVKILFHLNHPAEDSIYNYLTP